MPINLWHPGEVEPGPLAGRTLRHATAGDSLLVHCSPGVLSPSIAHSPASHRSCRYADEYATPQVRCRNSPKPLATPARADKRCRLACHPDQTKMQVRFLTLSFSPHHATRNVGSAH